MTNKTEGEQELKRTNNPKGQKWPWKQEVWVQLESHDPSDLHSIWTERLLFYQREKIKNKHALSLCARLDTLCACFPTKPIEKPVNGIGPLLGQTIIMQTGNREKAAAHTRQDRLPAWSWWRELQTWQTGGCRVSDTWRSWPSWQPWQRRRRKKIEISQRDIWGVRKHYANIDTFCVYSP